MTEKKNLDQVVANAVKARQEREQDYRAQSLKIHPWVCGRCGREFTEANLQELTVHHRDHNHDNNPADGSNWENLCVYCHDNEHSRYVDHLMGGGSAESKGEGATHNPLAGLKALMERGSKE